METFKNMALFSKKNLNGFDRVNRILQDVKFFNKYEFYSKYDYETIELGRDILFNEFDKLDDFYISLFNLKILCKWIENELPSFIYKKSKSHITIEPMEGVDEFCINLSKAIWKELA